VVQKSGGTGLSNRSAGREELRGRIRTKVEEKLRPLTLPNFITLFRMALAPFFVLAVNDHDFRLAAWIFIICGATDFLDGWLARILHARSRLGAYLDPIADKLLLTVGFVILTIPQGQEVTIPLWLAILALFRDFLIMLVALILYVVEGIRTFPPSILGKTTTFMHVVTLWMVLVANITQVPSAVMTACFYISFGLVIASGFNYLYRASKSIDAARQEGISSNEGE
jgi:cardiolipin synthase